MPEVSIGYSGKNPEVAETVADVFISYAHESLGVVKRISNALEEEGISYWIDKSNIQPSQKPYREIYTAIANCKVFLVILDKYSNQSEYVSSEIFSAFKRINNHENMALLPFKTEDCRLPIEIDGILSGIQIMEADPPTEDKINELVAQIARILSQKPEPNLDKHTPFYELYEPNEKRYFVFIGLCCIFVISMIGFFSVLTSYSKWNGFIMNIILFCFAIIAFFVGVLMILLAIWKR